MTDWQRLGEAMEQLKAAFREEFSKLRWAQWILGLLEKWRIS